MRFRFEAATFGCCLLLAGQAWSADTAGDAKLMALLPPGDDAMLCLRRSYDAQHLKNHPKQKVTEVLLALRYVKLNEDEATLIARDDGGIDKQYYRYDFILGAKVKDRSETLYASGDCGSHEMIGCGVDCDGGGIQLEPVAGEAAVLMHLDRIRMTIGCGGHGVTDLEGGEDDKLFKLEKSDPVPCTEMEATVRKGFE